MNRICVATVIALTALATAGCVGPKDRTTGQITEAHSKLATVKSGVEWQQAQQQFLAGDLDKALSSINKSLKVNPKVAKSHVLKGRIILEKGDAAAAAECFNQALVLDPENCDANYYLGIIAERTRDNAEALARYRRAMELDPSHPQYVIASAEMLVQLDQRNEAIQLLLSCSSDISNNAGIRQTLGQIEMLCGHYAKAAEYFGEARLIAPNDTQIIEQLAKAQVAAGQYADAEFYLSQLFKNDKTATRRDLQVLRARCLVQLDRLVDARTLLLKLTESESGQADAQTWIMLGEVCAKLNDNGRLRTISQRLISATPDRWEGYALKGLWLQRTNRRDEAAVAFKAAVDRCGDDVTPVVLYGALLSEMGKSAEARKCAERAMAMQPSSPLAVKLQNYIDGRTTGIAGASGTTD
ncbi:MAG: tetratricopeptide repeat protein [Phycisphaerales bacterium]